MKTKFSTTIDVSVLKELKIYCAQNSVSIGDTVNYALRDFVRDQKYLANQKTKEESTNEPKKLTTSPSQAK